MVTYSAPHHSVASLAFVDWLEENKTNTSSTNHNKRLWLSVWLRLWEEGKTPRPLRRSESIGRPIGTWCQLNNSFFVFILLMVLIVILWLFSIMCFLLILLSSEYIPRRVPVLAKEQKHALCFQLSLRSLNRNLFAGLDTEALGGLAGLAALEVVGGAVGGLVLADAEDGRHLAHVIGVLDEEAGG